MKKFVGFLVFVVIFIFIGSVVTSLTVKDNPNLSKEDIEKARECSSSFPDNPIANIPLRFGKKSVEKKVEDLIYVKFYTIFKIPVFTVVVKGSGCYLERYN